MKQNERHGSIPKQLGQAFDLSDLGHNITQQMGEEENVESEHSVGNETISAFGKPSKVRTVN